MMRCPVCRHSSYTRTSRYLSEQTKEAYYQCQNIECSCTFKTRESVEHVIRQPLTPETISAPPPPERRTLNRYGNNNRLH
ncbi:ogr/Delta-like zinc finger family protein [Serratia aquatilis]|uniref:Ogr/Delta-like zinc finger family protein n=1 Tax=Serratia aquatilis TaxID=1737515 RepID=A0ABV6EAT1_9GAMM